MFAAAHEPDLSVAAGRQLPGWTGREADVLRTAARDPSLPILNVGCPVANGSKADAPSQFRNDAIEPDRKCRANHDPA